MTAPNPKPPATDRQTERELAYYGKFGTRHPKPDQILHWARSIFPEHGSSLRLHTGLFRCTVREGGRSTVRHLRRTALMNGNAVLGVGSDAVEAVAAADVQKKQLSAARAAEKPKTTQESTPPMKNLRRLDPDSPTGTPGGSPPAATTPPAPVPTVKVDKVGVMTEAAAELTADQATIATQQTELGNLNQTVATLNANAAKHDASDYQDELNTLNDAAIALNAALGNPLPTTPLAVVPPVPTVAGSPNSGSGAQTTPPPVADTPPASGTPAAATSVPSPLPTPGGTAPTDGAQAVTPPVQGS